MGGTLFGLVCLRALRIVTVSFSYLRVSFVRSEFVGLPSSTDYHLRRISRAVLFISLVSNFLSSGYRRSTYTRLVPTRFSLEMGKTLRILRTDSITSGGGKERSGLMSSQSAKIKVPPSSAKMSWMDLILNICSISFSRENRLRAYFPSIIDLWSSLTARIMLTMSFLTFLTTCSFTDASFCCSVKRVSFYYLAETFCSLSDAFCSFSVFLLSRVR